MPIDNKLVENFYETKIFVADLGLPYEKIHCCINGCMLYNGEDIHKRSCKFCNQPRYRSIQRKYIRGKIDIPHQKMYYFPLTTKLQKLHASEVTAKYIGWHDKHDQKNDIISHPSDAKAWKHFDPTNPSFASKAQNVRLWLFKDGFQ